MKFDKAIVLLCGGYLDDNNNKWRTVARLELALQEFIKHKDACLLISSGISGHAKSGSRPEAHVYYEFMQRNYKHLDFSRIFVEDISRDTVGNVFFSLSILKFFLKNNSTVLWVTNNFHVKRLGKIINFYPKEFLFAANYVVAPDNLSLSVMKQIDAYEINSCNRFICDASGCANLEELIFVKHDFYAANRFNRSEI